MNFKLKFFVTMVHAVSAELLTPLILEASAWSWRISQGTPRRASEPAGQECTMLTMLSAGSSRVFLDETRWYKYICYLCSVGYNIIYILTFPSIFQTTDAYIMWKSVTSEQNMLKLRAIDFFLKQPIVPYFKVSLQRLAMVLPCKKRNLISACSRILKGRLLKLLWFD